MDRQFFVNFVCHTVYVVDLGSSNDNLYSENVAQLGIVYFNYMIAIST